MSEESKNLTWDEVMNNQLKNLDVKTLEGAIANTISTLVGIKYKCYIDKISYTDYSEGKGATFKVHLYEASHT